MSNRELVIDLVNKLPEDASLEEIIRKIELIAGLRDALAESERGEGTPAEEVRRLIKGWATKSS